MTTKDDCVDRACGHCAGCYKAMRSHFYAACDRAGAAEVERDRAVSKLEAAELQHTEELARVRKLTEDEVVVGCQAALSDMCSIACGWAFDAGMTSMMPPWFSSALVELYSWKAAWHQREACARLWDSGELASKHIAAAIRAVPLVQDGSVPSKWLPEPPPSEHSL